MNDADSGAAPLRRVQTMRWLWHIPPSVKLLYTSLKRRHPDHQSTEWRHRVEASFGGGLNCSCQQGPTTPSPGLQGAMDITAKTRSEYGRNPWSGMNSSSIWPHGYYTRRRPLFSKAKSQSGASTLGSLDQYRTTWRLAHTLEDAVPRACLSIFEWLILEADTLQDLVCSAGRSHRCT
jgi:hypothetical protein